MSLWCNIFLISLDYCEKIPKSYYQIDLVTSCDCTLQNIVKLFQNKVIDKYQISQLKTMLIFMFFPDLSKLFAFLSNTIPELTIIIKTWHDILFYICFIYLVIIINSKMCKLIATHRSENYQKLYQ